MNKFIIDRNDAIIEIQKLGDKNRIKVNLKNEKEFSPALEYETSYPLSLIEKLIEVKGPAWICN